MIKCPEHNKKSQNKEDKISGTAQEKQTQQKIIKCPGLPQKNKNNMFVILHHPLVILCAILDHIIPLNQKLIKNFKKYMKITENTYKETKIRLYL